MKDHKIERMKELVAVLSKAAFAYEQENREVMSNYEYDTLYDELKQLEEETGTILGGSVTQKVGYEVASSLPKVTHPKRMLSLDKTKEISKLKAFLGEEEGILSWKLDGLTIVCTYENGKLVSAVTRGNGTIGEEITNNARTFKNLPLSIDEKERLVLRGEAIITYSDFNQINESISVEENKYKNPRNLCSGSVRQLNPKERLVLRGEAIITYSDFNQINESISVEENKYKNPRNLCSGSVRQLNPEITAKRNVRLYAFTLVEGGPKVETKEEQLNWLSKKGFQIVEYKKVTTDTVEEAVEYFAQNVANQNFASDGLVLTYNNCTYSASLGETAKFPKDSIAFKWKDELVETKLLSIEWNTSRTGLINPVAIFEPVEIEGTTVERASVHNLSILEELQLGIGDYITVYKANMIIPQIAENLTRSGKIDIPKCCPVCGAHTEIKQDKETKTLICSNSNCKAQRLRAFTHFTTRDAMNIEGLSEATIEKFLERDYLEDFTSLYHLDQYESEIIEMEGLGKRSFTKLMKSIENSREVALANFIYALGIAQVGLGTAKLICKYFNNDLDTMMKASQEELTAIDGIGPVIALEFAKYFSLEANQIMVKALERELEFKAMMKASQEELTAIDGIGPVIALEFAKYFSLEANQIMVKALERELEFKVERKAPVEDSKIMGKTFVVTGDVHHFKNRKELQNKIEELGGKVTGSVSKNTDYLINNDSESGSSKNKKAKELGIPILTEEAFLELIR